MRRNRSAKFILKQSFYEKNYLFALLFLFSACSKQADVIEKTEKPIFQAANEKPDNKGLNNPPPDDDKKYAPIICYLPDDPTKVGTECSVPGNKCKSYDCTLLSGKSSFKLSEPEITHYSGEYVNLLLQKGYIDQKDIDYFKDFSGKILRERNKNLSKNEKIRP